MKKRVVSQVLLHLWRGALLLVLLFALIQVIPIAFGQRNLGTMAAGVSQAPASTGAAGVVAPAGQAVTKSRDNTLTSRSGTPTLSGGAGVSAPAPGLPNDSWAVRAPVPYPARGPFAVSDGTVLYVGGGYDGSNVHTDLLRYDPVANTFTPLAPSPDGHFLSQAVIFNNKIYNIAGFGLGIQTTTTRIYDIPSNTWSTGAPIPEANGLSDHATGLISGRIYIAGGYNGSGAISTLRIYNIAANTWTTGAPMPAALFLPGFGVINGRLYIASGNNGSTEVNTLYIYDIASNTWTIGPPVPTPVTAPGSAVFNGRLYLYGGGAPFPTTITITQIYDPATNTWTTGPNMNVNRLWFYGGAIGNSSIVAPGGDTTPGTPVSANEQLTTGGGVPLGGTVCVGTGTCTGDVYPSLTGPGGLFDAINTRGLGSSLIAEIISDIPNETGAVALNQWVGPSDCGCTVTIRPRGAPLQNSPNGGVPRTVSGSVTGALIRILASRVTIDGSLGGGGTDRSLTITNTSTSSPTVILFGSVGTTPIGDDTLKNCTIINGVNTSSAVVISDSATLGNPGYFDGVTIQHNSIQKAYIGVYANGGTSPQSGANLMYLDNDLNTSGANAIRFIGLYMQGVNGAMVWRNRIGNFSGSEPEDDRGIWFAAGTINATADSNMVSGLNYTGTDGYGGYGLAISTVQANANITVSNNMISNISGDGFDYTGNFYTDNPFGIFAFSTQTGINIYFNSINLYGNTLNQPNALSAGVVLATGTTADVRDNAIVNNLGLLAGTGYGSTGMWLQSSASQLVMADYNDYFVNPSGSGVKAIGQIATTPSLTLAAWRVATGRETNSISANPLFVSPTNLHLASGSPAQGAGNAIPGITTDFDGDTRPAVPSIGADEPPPVPTVVSAVSRKIHGGAGTFDINMPLTGSSGVESRTGGATNDYRLVVTFSGNVTVTGSPQAQVTSGTGCVGSGGVCTGNVSVSGAVVTVLLTNIGNAQVINVRINGVNSAASDAPAVDVNIQMGFLIGDVNANRAVNAADIALTKSQTGQTVTASNFRADVNVNGSINAGDIALAKQYSGTSLPPD